MTKLITSSKNPKLIPDLESGHLPSVAAVAVDQTLCFGEGKDSKREQIFKNMVPRRLCFKDVCNLALWHCFALCLGESLHLP